MSFKINLNKRKENNKNMSKKIQKLLILKINQIQLEENQEGLIDLKKIAQEKEIHREVLRKLNYLNFN